LPETHLDWTPAAVQATPGLSRQRPSCLNPEPNSPSTFVGFASPCICPAEMRRTVRSLSRLTPTSRSASACSQSVDGGPCYSSAIHRWNDLTHLGAYNTALSRALCSETARNTRSAAPANCTDAPAAVGGAKEAQSAKDRGAGKDDTRQRGKLHPPRHALEQFRALGTITSLTRRFKVPKIQSGGSQVCRHTQLAHPPTKR
jgi:hypothetical protein